MRRLAFLALATVVITGSASAGAGTEPGTSLTVAYWERGLPSIGVTDPVTWTLRCRPARGTLPRPVIACSRLAAGGRELFTPVPKDAICTEIYGGPQIARVIGVVDGKRVWATFSRTNGCHISRWNRLFPWLLPRGGTTR
jgi:Subtilisin inhibitor-like